jgi:hypothetical protein
LHSAAAGLTSRLGQHWREDADFSDEQKEVIKMKANEKD